MKKAVRRSRATKSSGPSAGLSTELALAVGAAADKKALDLTVLDLRKGLAFTDFFVICTGANTRQVQAIADAIQESLRKHGTKAALIEGVSRGEWILIDYFDFVVHIFTPATREFYGLERLWGDAERIEIPA
jgi:ribosome-associated protein